MGILIYQMFTGSLPFQGDNTQVIHAQVHAPVPAHNVSDPVIRAVVVKATAKAQAERYQDAMSLISDIHKTEIKKPGRNKQNTHGGATPRVPNDTGIKPWIWALCAVAGLVTGVLISLFT
jgi:hypothetical protein